MIKKATPGKGLRDNMRKILFILAGCEVFNSATGVVIIRNPIVK